MTKSPRIYKIYESKVDIIEARVKWYNPKKKYGFLSTDDNSEDILINHHVLEHYGLSVEKEDRIVCKVSEGYKGRKVMRVLEIKFSPKEEKNENNVYTEDLETRKGQVKWFNPVRGYGFITPDDEGPDVFLHSSVLYAAEYQDIKPGTRVLFKVVLSKGKDAVTHIKVIE